MGGGTGTTVAAIVGTVEIFDIVIALVKVIVQVVPTIRADQQAAENVSFAVFWLALTDFAAFLLNLLPNGTLDNRLMHILENHIWIMVVLFHLVGC